MQKSNPWQTAAFPGLLAAAVVVVACGLGGLEIPRRNAGGEVGEAALALTGVPEEVKCIRITAAGTGRSEEREIDVATAGDMLETLSGLPLGTVVFRGEAFTTACTQVSRATVAAWASEPVSTSIVIGRLASVTLVMTRNGRAKVDVTFNNEAACTALGLACRVPTECCSRRCTAGLCAIAADGGGD